MEACAILTFKNFGTFEKYFDYVETRKGLVFKVLKGLQGSRLQGAKRAIQNLDEKPENYLLTIVKSRRGDVVLWYSTLPHQNSRTRSVCYILLTDKRDIDIRKNAWVNKRVFRLSTAEKGAGYQYTLQHPVLMEIRFLAYLETNI
jgi:hypothetical protein